VELELTGNRITAEAKIMTGYGYPFKHSFILDTGATIFTMSKKTAVSSPFYSRNLGVDIGCEVLAQEEN
jgi:hypothetical protein